MNSTASIVHLSDIRPVPTYAERVNALLRRNHHASESEDNLAVHQEIGLSVLESVEAIIMFREHLGC